MKFPYNKRVILIVTFQCCAAFFSFSQDTLAGKNNNSQKTKKHINIQPVSNQLDIWSLNVGLISTLSPSPIETNGVGFNLGLTYHYEISLNKSSSLALSFGLGYLFHNYKHSGVFFNDSTPSLNWSSGVNYEGFTKSSFRVHEFVSPIEFRIRTDQTYKLYLGYHLGVLLGAKNISTINEERIELKNPSSMNQFFHGPQLRIGFKDIFIFSRYRLTPYFNNPNLKSHRTLEFGISIGG